MTKTPTTTPTYTPTMTPTISLTSSVTSTPSITPIPFVSVWRTTTPNETIQLPLVDDGNYSFNINWGAPC